MATCSWNEPQWSVTGGGTSTQGTTKRETCIVHFSRLGTTSNVIVSSDGNSCTRTTAGAPVYPLTQLCETPTATEPTEPTDPTGNVIECGEACSVQIAFASVPLTAEKAGDMLILTSAFLLVMVLIWKAKAIASLFTTNHER